MIFFSSFHGFYFIVFYLEKVTFRFFYSPAAEQYARSANRDAINPKDSLGISLSGATGAAKRVIRAGQQESFQQHLCRTIPRGI